MSGERQEERGCRKGRDEERREGRMEEKRRECAREEHKKRNLETGSNIHITIVHRIEERKQRRHHQ